MIELPFDYSRCMPRDCERKEYCARFTSKWDTYRQTVSDFSKHKEEDNCEYFIDNKKGGINVE